MRGKKIWGRKRFLLVDTLGLLLAVLVVAADMEERNGAKRFLEPFTVQDFPRLQLMWADQGYSGDPFAIWLREHLGCRLEILKQPWIERPGKWVWKRDRMTWQREHRTSSGFQVIPKRWIVERSIAWMTRWRRLARDHEGLPASSEAFIKLSAIRRMLSHLALSPT
ncbi:MAG: transposase [Ktedonobacteraceae bacterium]